MGENDQDTNRFYASIDARLEQLRAGQIELVKQITEVSVHQRDTNGDVANIMAELGGAPDWRSRGSRETIRGRLQRLDTEKYTVDRDKEIQSRMWSRRQKIALFAIALITGTFSVLQGIHVL